MDRFFINECYETLGLTPTYDLKEVKKAYARLVKQYHPEEDIEQYQKIMNAYKTLCDYLSEKKSYVNVHELEQNYSFKDNSHYAIRDGAPKDYKRDNYLGELLDGKVKEVYIHDLVDNSEDTDYIADSNLINEIAKMADVAVNDYNEEKIAEQKKNDFILLKPLFDCIESSGYKKVRVLTLNNMSQIIKSPLYYMALKDAFFVVRFTEFLSRHQIEEELAEKIYKDIKDIDKGKQIYQRMYSVLESRKITKKEIKKADYASRKITILYIILICYFILIISLIMIIIFIQCELFYGAIAFGILFFISAIVALVANIIKNNDSY